MRAVLLVAALAAVPVAAYADPTACATTVSSKGIEATVCTPGEPSTNEPLCHVYDPGFEMRPVPYVKVCLAP